jgi:hypothetical protein
MINRLVVNGCSYTHAYTDGFGHVELANLLTIAETHSLTKPGSSNQRIIRTTLKDSYTTSKNTFYIIGLSFLNRIEFPVGVIDNEIEGRWLNFQNAVNPNHLYDNTWNFEDSKKLIDLKIKSEILSVTDRLEYIMYQLVSMINDLTSRGHQVLIFRQPTDIYDSLLNDEPFTLLKKYVNIIDGLSWSALEWQFNNGVNWDSKDDDKLLGHRHPCSGQHHTLNKFLLHYIQKNQLL